MNFSAFQNLINFKKVGAVFILFFKSEKFQMRIGYFRLFKYSKISAISTHTDKFSSTFIMKRFSLKTYNQAYPHFLQINYLILSCFGNNASCL